MRLAASGLVDADSGSIAGAGFLVLRELLDRGIEIDFFANSGYVPEPKGLASSRFTYLGFDGPQPLRLMPRRMYFLTNWGLTPLVRGSWQRAFGRVARTRHGAKPYDALLSLGTPPYFTLDGVRTVTWLQGAPHTEVDALRRLRPMVVDTLGRAQYFKLRVYYVPRRFYDRKILATSDFVICGSRWAQDELIRRGVPNDRTKALPYPIDLERFRPPKNPGIDWSQPEILWLGRIVPRKRLDLLMDAFPLVAGSIPGVHLRVVGAPAYAPGQLRLLRNGSTRHRVTYQSRVARDEVSALLQRSAVVVQTSESEDFGSSIAEAQACGVPVVVGATNGTGDYIDPCSRVFMEYSPDAVAAAIVEVLDLYRARGQEVSESARASAERWFDPSKVVDKLLLALGVEA